MGYSIKTQLSIPAEASLYILLQRTAYQSAILKRLLRRFPGPISLAYARLEAALRRNAIVPRFQRGILRDFRSIEAALPPTVANVLDIGCGLAAIDVLISRHFSKPSPPSLFLADFEETNTSLDYSFGISHSRYNSFVVARELLLDNGIPLETLHMISPEEIGRNRDLPCFDLVISTLAWGFHFPVESYSQAVSDVMADGGRLILDIRTNTVGIEQLGRYFHVAQILEKNESRQRVLAIRQPSSRPNVEVTTSGRTA
jgi:SAM-dependent methyltransferase